jgi:5-oxoprolinase (ATP-hydrolysing) subunit C
VIEIVSAAGLATVQDGGRPGHMHEGVPPGGALVPQMLARANTAAHNAPGEAAIEALGTLALVARLGVTIGTDDGATHALREGAMFTIESDQKSRVRYVALRGGIDVPRVLGGRGTLVVARLGGHEGRPLRRGDVLRIGGAGPVSTTPRPEPRTYGGSDEPINVVLGPDLDRFPASTVETFLVSSFTVDARSDRVGTRLIGPRLVSGEQDAVSAPMVRGAIQVPPSGEPIVLGPDHPTTGGYPVIATLVRDHLGLLEARPTGALVRFVIVRSRGT